MTTEQIKKRMCEITAIAIEKNGGNPVGCGDFFTPEMNREYEELNERESVICCMAYGEDYIYSQKHKYKNYTKHHTVEEAKAIWEDQRDYFKRHAKVTYGVHMDHEGCIYNSVDWK